MITNMYENDQFIGISSLYFHLKVHWHTYCFVFLIDNTK
jgi:hypothetical protein